MEEKENKSRVLHASNSPLLFLSLSQMRCELCENSFDDDNNDDDVDDDDDENEYSV